MLNEKTMKAMVWVGPKKLELQEVPYPTSDGQSMIVKVKAVGICGSDIHGNWVGGWGPKIIGHEICGEVVSPGSNTELKPGDRVVVVDINPCGTCKYCTSGREDMCPQVITDVPGVTVNGGFAEYLSVKRADLVQKIPDTMTDIEGALVEPVAVAIHANHRGKVTPGSNVLICGSGTIGMFSAAVARSLGAKTITITGANPERRKVALNTEFLDNVIDSHAEDFDDQLKAIAPDGFDTILECSGIRSVQESAMKHLAIGGVFTLVGFRDLNFTANSLDVYQKQQTIQGCMMMTQDEFKLAIDLINEKKVDLVRFTETAPLEKAQDCLLRAESSNCPVLKFILIP